MDIVIQDGDRKKSSAIAKGASRALAMVVFLMVLKGYLIIWYRWQRGINVLEELSWIDRPLIFGGEVLLGCALWFFYTVLYKASELVRRWKRLAWALAMGPALIHVSLALFSTISWQVNQVYSTPLDMNLLRAADKLGTSWGSISAYLGPAIIMAMALGAISYWYPGKWIEGLLRKLKLPRTAWGPRIVFIMIIVVVGYPYLTRLNQYYTYGLKKNYVLHFIQYLKPLRSAGDVGKLREELLKQAGDKAGWSLKTDVLTTSAEAKPAAMEGTGRGMNVLLIIMESTTAEYVNEKTAPNIAKLGKTGVTFDHYYTAGTETPNAVYSILYSDHLPYFGAAPRELYRRPLPLKSLQGEFKKAGYQTSIHTSTPADFSDLEYIISGFDTMVDANIMTHGKTQPWVWGTFEDDTVSHLSTWLEEHRQGPFFAVYQTVFPHHPYITPPGVEKPFPMDSWPNRYQNALHYADSAIGDVMKILDNLDLRSNTIVVVTGDHGETVTGPVGHGLEASLSEMHVPLVISNPKLFPTERRSGNVSQHTDLGPSILGMTGIEAPAEWLGQNLLSPNVQSREVYLRILQAGYSVLIDDQFAVVQYPQGKSKLFKIGDHRMEHLSDCDLSPTIRGELEERSKLFLQWAMLRHFDRAFENER